MPEELDAQGRGPRRCSRRAEPNAHRERHVRANRARLLQTPVTNRYNVSVDKGLLSASGQFEFGSRIRRIELTEATVDGVNVDYIHMPQTAVVEQARVSGAVKAAEAASNAPDLLLKIGRLRVSSAPLAT